MQKELLPARPPLAGELGEVPAISEIKVGDLVGVYSRGAERLAMVEKIGRTNVGVIYTTKGAWDEAHRIVEAFLGRDAEEAARDAAKMAAKNYEFYVRESEAATAKHAIVQSWQRGDAAELEAKAEAERAEHRATLARIGTREEYIAAEMADARAEVEAKRAQAMNGPEQYVHVTRKSVPHADLLGWRAA